MKLKCNGKINVPMLDLEMKEYLQRLLWNIITKMVDMLSKKTQDLDERFKLKK